MERYNSRLEGYEAMTALEVIEHLDPHILSRFGVVTMGTYRPRILLVTTPVSLSSPLALLTLSFLLAHLLHRLLLRRTPTRSYAARTLLTTRTSTSMPNSPETDMMNREKDLLIPQEGQRGCLGTSSRPGRQAILFLYLLAAQWLP
jgi:hypothetical protein